MSTLSIPEENVGIGFDNKQRKITMKHIRMGFGCTVPDDTPVEEHDGCTISQITIDDGIWRKSVNISPKLVRQIMVQTFIKYAKSTYNDAGMSDRDGFKNYVTVQIPKIVPNWSVISWAAITMRLYKIMEDNDCSLEEACDK